MDNQTFLANSGAPFEFDYEGRGKKERVRVLYRVQRIKAKFERWAKDRAVQEILAVKQMLDQEDYRQRMREKLDQFESDDPETGYNYDGKRLRALRQTEAGKLAHARTMIDGGESWTDEELQDLLLDRGDEIVVYCEACSARVEELLKELGPSPDPKAMARLLKKAGFWA